MATEITSKNKLVSALMMPEAYPEPTEEIRLVETHISYLFFTGTYVYKVKKPVNYGFLDFTSLHRRHLYCLQEVALNSRLSPDVYRGVVAVREDAGYIAIDGPGETIDYAVKMRELPAHTALNEVLERGELTETETRLIAAKIAKFHDEAETGPIITSLGDLKSVWQNVDENFLQTEPYIGVAISPDEYDDLFAYSRAFMDAERGLFASRAWNRRIRDGHGDLHAANIFLDDGIHIIDCIEFNDRFRCADVAEDIAFLAMDLDYHGRPDLSDAFVEAYVEYSGDSGVARLLDFFKAYRAYVRGKVISFRLDDDSVTGEEREDVVEKAKKYFMLAHSYAVKSTKVPAVYVVAGLMGTGKTRVAEELARRWDLSYISSDKTRKELAGVGATEHGFDDYGEGIYTDAYTRRTYDALYGRANDVLITGKSVVIDATFRRGAERMRAYELASATGADFHFIECVASEDEIKKRLESRLEEAKDTVSDGRWELFNRQKEDWEPVTELPSENYIALDTNGPLEENVRALLEALFSMRVSTASSA